jgi:hypothetical protein
MLRLQSKETFWIEPLAGVRVHMRPIGPKAFRAAQEACFDALGGDNPDPEEASFAIERELIRRGIIEWEGVGDLEGHLLPVTPEAIDLYVSDPRTFVPTAALYVTPFLLRDLEGNASAGSLNGTGTKATPAKDTAISPAAMEGSPDALAAKSALTGRTRQKPTKAKRSGKSSRAAAPSSALPVSEPQ